MKANRTGTGRNLFGERLTTGRALLVLAASLVLASDSVEAEPMLILSISSGTGVQVCDSDPPFDCVTVSQEDLLLCRPTSSGLPIDKCDWEVLLDGNAAGLDNQLRAIEVAPNGNIALVTLNDDAVPGIPGLSKNDIALFAPADVLGPYVGGGAYTSGSFKLYLNGQLTQSGPDTVKPWDAFDLLKSDNCQSSIVVTPDTNFTCPVVGSLTGGAGAAGLGGIHFKNEDLLRCVPTAWAGNGTVEACNFSMFLNAANLDADNDGIPEPGQGITSDIEAIDFLSFDPATMIGQMVFKKGSGTPPGFPPSTPGRDLLLYAGEFGSGLCVPSNKKCAGNVDCPTGETCNTGTCAIGGAPCAGDGDCSSGSCNLTRIPQGNVVLYFDGEAAGLSGSGKNIEAFAIVLDEDDDGLPDGLDNCPDVDNPPSVCSGGTQSCPSGLSSECPTGEFCVQADADGDGVGDPCDQCNGRDDAVCFCGDFILDRPSEDCDLGDPNNGGFNGQPGSPCSSSCQIKGTCTTSGNPCTSAADCPSGEGCCGDAVTDSPAEQCDDGNAINDDACDNSCMNNPFGTPVLGCEDVTGPHLVPAFAKKTQLKQTKDAPPDLDRWQTKGDFNLVAGVLIDPDSEPVTITFNNLTSGLLFQKTLPAASFTQQGTKLKWKFLDKLATLVPGWRKGKFSQRQNKVRFVLNGRNATVSTVAALGAPPGFRQTIRVGDVCATTVVSCVAKSGGKVVACPP